MSRRSGRRRAAPPGIEALPKGVQVGLSKLVRANAETVRAMLGKDEDVDPSELVKACGTVIGQQKLTPESFLARFFSKEMLSSHCASIGISKNGSEAVLAARISKAWNKPGFGGDQKEEEGSACKKKRPRTDDDDGPKKSPRSELRDLVDASKNFSFTLSVETSKPPVQHGKLLNRFEAPDAEMASCSIEVVNRYNPDAEEPFTPLSDEELGSIAVSDKTLTFSCHSGEIKGEYDAPCDAGFTLRDVFDALAQWEMKRRISAANKWFDGIDAHHVFFEGFHLCDDGSLRARWGS